MLTPTNKLGRRRGARRGRHAVADAAVFVAAILVALGAAAARAEALSPGLYPTLSPQEPRQSGSFPSRPKINEVPAEYHLMTVGATAAGCPQVVSISYSGRAVPDPPLPWSASTKMAMTVVGKDCLTRVWYIDPSGESNYPYELNSKPELNAHITKSRSLEKVLQIVVNGADGFFPLLGWTDGSSENLSAECRKWLEPPWTFWAFFRAGSKPMKLQRSRISYGTLPAGAKGALLSTRTGDICAYAEAGATSSTPPPASRGEAERQWTPLPTATGTNKEGSLSSAARRRVTIGIGIGSSLFAALAMAAGVAVVRRRLAATAAALDTSDGDGTDRSGCPHCVGAYGKDVCVNCLVHAGSVDGNDGDVNFTASGCCSRSGMGGMGEVVTGATGGGADSDQAGAVAQERALDATMVSSIGDDLTVDGLFYTYPPRAASVARRPDDSTQSIGSSEGSACVSSLSDHMDVDGLVREALQLPPLPPPR